MKSTNRSTKNASYVDGYTILVLAVITLAYFFPLEKTFLDHLPMEGIVSGSISLIFFFYGLKLSPAKLKAGLSNWKLHLLIQLSTFLLFPMLVIGFRPFVDGSKWEAIWMGMFFLAALPSTVSSSVVMVSIAKGNIPASIFNSSISGLIGIAITPLWLGVVIQSETNGFDFSGIYLQLLFEILLPVLLGVLLQRWGGVYAERYSKRLSLFDKTIILLIIYRSFSHSFSQNLFKNLTALDLVAVFVLVLVLFFIVFGLLGSLANQFRFNREDRITAQYCGTKKSLVHGTVFFSLIFQDVSEAGIILLPLMVFHSAQILIISVMANRKNKERKGRSTRIVYPFI